ncbi:SDR family NAD(P)-dependent oxidoreductase [Rhodovulum sp. YNF3179]|jgi:7-alpha-hydroxysteroid dehydrogenase|uniref:SDR family NAD(P)-dependent oxidoreductase n=1 Tax=Rhodovulum sp. YNF3179 TaxID=3425127 RepID=UPI003D32BC22
MTFSVAGKTAIVTGAANGVGLAIARRFVDAGANVMFADMDEARLKDEIGKSDADASTARAFAGDLREKLTQANLLSATIDAFDRVDILVNGSRQVMFSDPLDRDDDSVDTLLQQNLLANLRLSQLVAKRMIAQAEESGEEEGTVGAIVNLSSVAGQRTRPDLLAYSVSCAALDQLTRSLAVALAPHRIRVNAIAFGSVMSASLRQALRDDSDLRDAITTATPLGRIAPPGEVADAAQFLASDSAGFITGEILRVDGGRSILDAVVASAH